MKYATKKDSLDCGTACYSGQLDLCSTWPKSRHSKCLQNVSFSYFWSTASLELCCPRPCGYGTVYNIIDAINIAHIQPLFHIPFAGPVSSLVLWSALWRSRCKYLCRCCSMCLSKANIFPSRFMWAPSQCLCRWLPLQPYCSTMTPIRCCASAKLYIAKFAIADDPA